LTSAIASGLLDDTSESSLRERLASSDDEHWYNKLVQTEGRDAAESSFKNWPLRSERAMYGSAVRVIVESMVAVAQQDKKDELVCMVSPAKEDYSFPLGSSTLGFRTAVILTNPALDRCCLKTPEGYDVWGIRGSLKLHALALLKTRRNVFHAQGRTGVFYELYLVFEAHKLLENTVTGYTLVEFGTDGMVTVDTHCLLMPESRGFFRQRVSGTRQPNVSFGGDLDSQFFPGAREYFIRHLPVLPVYLSAMASLLQKENHS
jgi:hypothetical protein